MSKKPSPDSLIAVPTGGNNVLPKSKITTENSLAPISTGGNNVLPKSKINTESSLKPIQSGIHNAPPPQKTSKASPLKTCSPVPTHTTKTLFSPESTPVLSEKDIKNLSKISKEKSQDDLPKAVTSGTLQTTTPTNTTLRNFSNQSINTSTTVQAALDPSLSEVLTQNIEQIIKSGDNTFIVKTDKDVYVNTYEQITEQKYINTLGISGESGYSGAMGASGYSGFSGIDGIGISGYSGINGESGYSGISGLSGYSGQLGASGISGYSGIQGANALYDSFTNLPGSTGVVVHDFSLGSVFRHTSIAGNFTANVINLNLASGSVTNVSVILVQGVTPYMPTALQIGGVAQTINWLNSSPPTGTSNKIDIVNFSILNNSSVYTVIGQSATFG